jgi:hypothetical protein
MEFGLSTFGAIVVQSRKVVFAGGAAVNRKTYVNKCIQIKFNWLF